ncbi:hypothetical protein ACEUZ9_000976 [Paracoccus litorisediminis]|uniref:hypothetical protein n=1 Tax=Paracoccus litorisediminis TaxID=2006130 RepID=UPI003734291C
MDLHDGAVYVDSPIPAAVRQVSPFFEQGIFCAQRTPLLLRKRVGTGFGLFACKEINGVPVRMIDGDEAKKMPVRKGGAIFYSFNSQGNMHTVANRGYRHVLVLHGESNKRASARPAARLYDYICVAGDIAAERYIDAGIFHPKEFECHRLIKTGDTFVQGLGSYHVAPETGDAILYAPTWEGFGGALNDYSSISTGGLAMAETAMRLTGRSTLVIRPHPYLGMLRPRHLRDLIRGALDLGKRHHVRFDLGDANAAVRALVWAAIRTGRPGIGMANGKESIALCLCDVSAMESCCLKGGLPHMVLSRNFTPPDALASHYAVKAASNPDEISSRLPAYLADPAALDSPFRARMFTVSHPDFLSPDGAVRLNRLMIMIGKNSYWG